MGGALREHDSIGAHVRDMRADWVAKPRGGETPARVVRSRSVSQAGFASWHYVVASVLVGTVGYRLLEFIPALAVVKPILLITIAAFGAFVVSTPDSVLHVPLRLSSSRWMLGFYFWMFACVPTSVWISASVSVVRGMVLTGIAAWLLLSLPKTSASADRLQHGFALSAGVFSLMVALLGGETFSGRYGAAIGLDVNDIALVVAAALPLAIGLALRGRGLLRMVYWSLSAVMVVTIMRTGSRGGGLALLALIPVLLIGLPWRRSLQFVLLGVPLATGAWYTAPESFRVRMVSLLEGEEDYNQTDENGRIAIWKRGISYGLEHPVFGVGPNGFITQDGIGKAQRGLQGKWSAPHNTYVQVFAEMGFPGLLLFVGLIGSVWRVAWRAHRGIPGHPITRRPEYLASLVAYVVAATFLSFLFYHMTWILLAGLATMATGAIRHESFADGKTAGGALGRGNRVRRRGIPRASRVVPAPAG